MIITHHSSLISSLITHHFFFIFFFFFPPSERSISRADDLVGGTHWNFRLHRVLSVCLMAALRDQHQTREPTSRHTLPPLVSLLVLTLHTSLLDLGPDGGSNVVHRCGQFLSLSLSLPCVPMVILAAGIYHYLLRELQAHPPRHAFSIPSVTHHTALKLTRIHSQSQ